MNGFTIVEVEGSLRTTIKNHAIAQIQNVFSVLDTIITSEIVNNVSKLRINPSTGNYLGYKMNGRRWLQLFPTESDNTHNIKDLTSNVMHRLSPHVGNFLMERIFPDEYFGQQSYRLAKGPETDVKKLAKRRALTGNTTQTGRRRSAATYYIVGLLNSNGLAKGNDPECHTEVRGTQRLHIDGKGNSVAIIFPVQHGRDGYNLRVNKKMTSY